MASKAALSRLTKEYQRIVKDPVENIEARPSADNLLIWHYVVQGPKGSPYEGGYYHGTLTFPVQYPYKPPAIAMITPNGRFKTNTRLCLSMSDFHPETWNPLWSVSSILSGLVSFMLENTPTYGSMDASDEARRKYAADSLAYNLRDATFNSLFPRYKKVLDDQKAAGMLERKKSLGGGSSGETKQAAPAAEKRAPPEDNVDKIVMLLVVVTVAFALSFLYS